MANHGLANAVLPKSQLHAELPAILRRLLPNRVNYAGPCTEQATSPDGKFFTFLAGNISSGGSLFMVEDTDDPVEFVRNLTGPHAGMRESCTMIM